MRYEQTFEKPGNCLDFWISWLFNRIRLGNLQFKIYTATYKDRGSRKVFGHIHLASQSRASGKGVDRIGTACFCFARCYPATFALPLSALESWTTAIPKAPHDKIDSDLLVERCLWTTSPYWTLYSEYPDLDNCLFEEETWKAIPGMGIPYVSAVSFKVSPIRALTVRDWPFESEIVMSTLEK